MPGEPVCRRESRAGEPVVDSGYMEPASLVLTCSLLHGGKILEEKQNRGAVVQKTSWVCPGGSVTVKAQFVGYLYVPPQTDRPTHEGSDKADGWGQWLCNRFLVSHPMLHKVVLPPQLLS